MVIGRSEALTSLPILQDQAQGRHSPGISPADQQQEQGQNSGSLIQRTVEDVEEAERLLNEYQSSDRYYATSDDARQTRALHAYQSLMQSDERDYVSEVLGIDVFA